MELNFKKLNSNAIIPTRSTPDSMSLDIYACFEGNLCMRPHTALLVPTGLAVSSSQKDVVLLIYPRPNLAVKKGIILASSVSVIDSDYRDEIKVPLYNNSYDLYVVNSGDKIAQLIVTPIMVPAVNEVQELDETLRGSNDYDSTRL